MPKLYLFFLYPALKHDQFLFYIYIRRLKPLSFSSGFFRFIHYRRKSLLLAPQPFGVLQKAFLSLLRLLPLGFQRLYTEQFDKYVLYLSPCVIAQPRRVLTAEDACEKELRRTQQVLYRLIVSIGLAVTEGLPAALHLFVQVCLLFLSFGVYKQKAPVPASVQLEDELLGSVAPVTVVIVAESPGRIVPCAVRHDAVRMKVIQHRGLP